MAVHSPSATKIDNSVEVEQPAIVSTDRIMTGGSNAEDLTSLYKEQPMDLITLEVLSDSNMEGVRRIQRDDICEAFVDTADTIIKLNQYGIDHHCKGHTYAVKRADECIGVILLGEALE